MVYFIVSPWFEEEAFADFVRAMSGKGEEETVSVASLLVAAPLEFVTMTLYFAPLSDFVAGGVVYEERLAPDIAILFFCHPYDRGAVPVAETVKVAVAPSRAVSEMGSARMDGATDVGGEAETVIVSDFVAFAPPLSETVRVALKVPAAAYVCVRFCVVPRDVPSPKFHE